MKGFLVTLVLGCLYIVPAARGEFIEPVRAAVFRSQGTIFTGMTIWPELNTGWSAFGDVPVKIDHRSLAGNNISYDQLEATGADVIILSSPGFLTYKQDEILALRQYVEAGHGLIITYSTFRSADRALAELVGLSSTISLGTGTANNPFRLNFNMYDHPLMNHLSEPYFSGVPYGTTGWGAAPWSLAKGIVVAELMNDVITPRPGIVSHETENFRSLYFSYYIEDKTGGANQQDMQVFYNGLLWTAGIPEPATAFLCSLAGSLVLLRRQGCSAYSF